MKAYSEPLHILNAWTEARVFNGSEYTVTSLKVKYGEGRDENIETFKVSEDIYKKAQVLLELPNVSNSQFRLCFSVEDAKKVAVKKAQVVDIIAYTQEQDKESAKK